MRTFIKQNRAFTMLELVFAIVVLGIITAVALPRMDRDLTQEAEENIVSAIRYTQHLALLDDKTDPFDNNWQSRLWNITFAADGSSYAIGSDTDGSGTVDADEMAIDPANGRIMDGSVATGSPEADIGKKYGTDGAALVFAGGCAGTTTIAFDHLGRPFTAVAGATNNYANYMGGDIDCTITVTLEQGDPIVITIERETGYVSSDL